MRYLTMFRPIRIRAGSAIFCPYNTPLLFVKNMPCRCRFNELRRWDHLSMGSYADRCKPPSGSGQSCTSTVSRELPSAKCGSSVPRSHRHKSGPQPCRINIQYQRRRVSQSAARRCWAALSQFSLRMRTASSTAFAKCVLIQS